MIKQKQKNHSPVSDAFRFADYFGGTFSFLGAVSFRWTVCGGGLSGSIMWTWFRFPKVWTLRQHSFFTLLFVKLPFSLGNFQVGLNFLNHFFIAILLKLSYALLTRPTQICFWSHGLHKWTQGFPNTNEGSVRRCPFCLHDMFVMSVNNCLMIWQKFHIVMPHIWRASRKNNPNGPRQNS